MIFHDYSMFLKGRSQKFTDTLKLTRQSLIGLITAIGTTKFHNLH